MKKQQKQLIILLVLLAVCALAYFGIRYSNKKAAEESESEEEAGKTEVCDIAADDVNELSFLIDGTEYIFTRNGEDWICETDPALNIDSDKINTKLAAFEDLKADEKIDSTGDLSDYGLDSPVNVVSFSTDDGEYIFNLGSYNGLVGGYYLSTGDDIYLVDSTLNTAFGSVTTDSIIAEEEETEDTETAELTVDGTEAE